MTLARDNREYVRRVSRLIRVRVSANRCYSYFSPVRSTTSYPCKSGSFKAILPDAYMSAWVSGLPPKTMTKLHSSGTL